MPQKLVFFKSDFKVILDSESGWDVPFKLKFYTNAPSRAFFATFDGTTYTNCEVTNDDRLLVAFDNHGLGLGKLMLEPTFYLDDQHYADGICDEVIPASVVTVTDSTVTPAVTYELVLSLQGASALETTGTLPAYYMQGTAGHTPVKGVDYFTTADKEELVDDVVDELQPTIAAAQAATTAATTATSNANTKAGLANTAATNANTKAALANTAAGTATSAASTANEKAGLANNAAISASSAAATATAAANNANVQASAAETAARTATSAATGANTAAANAAAAAGTATSAATSATTAANAANTAATAAQTAASTATSAATSATTAAGNASSAATAAQTAAQAATSAAQEADEKMEEFSTAETARASAETARVTAEGTRVTAETERVAAETARASAETSRVSAETSRVSAEGARVSAEATRQTNETTRQTNETARQTAEATRQSTFETNEAARAATATAARAAEATTFQEKESERDAAVAVATALTPRVVAVEGDTAGIKGGTIVPPYAGNLKSWAERSSIAVNDEWNGVPVRTTAGDLSITGAEGAHIITVKSRGNFTATGFSASPFNLIIANQLVGGVPYILVPACAFGTFGTADQNNGILVTASNGTNKQVSMRFKPYASGVPSSINDGSVCPYQDSNGYRFYLPAQMGYIWASDMSASDCAHIAWSKEYNKYEAPSAFSSISFATIINKFTQISGVWTMLAVSRGADVVQDQFTFANNVFTWTKACGYDTAAWTDTPIYDESEAIIGYHHEKTISAMALNGMARDYANAVELFVTDKKVWFEDTNATTSVALVYQLDVPTSGTVSLANSYTPNDMGCEYIEGMSGDSTIVTSYYQGIPDSLVAMLSKVPNALETISNQVAMIIARTQAITTLGNLRVRNLTSDDIPKVCGAPLILRAAGVPAEATIPEGWDNETMGEWTGVPMFIGQLYINTAVNTGGFYYAKGDGAISDWKLS